MQKKQEPIRKQRSELLKLFTERHLHGQEALKIVEPMRGKTDKEKELIAEKILREMKVE